MHDKKYSIRQEMLEAAIRAKVPISAQLELTRLCPLDCIHCYVDHTKPGSLSTKEWMDIIDQIAKMGTFNITFTGGDPFVRKDFLQLVEHAHKHGFLINILAAWWEVPDSVLDELAKFRIARLSFSFYGADAEMHDSITKRAGSFNRLLDTIKRATQRDLPIEPKFFLMSRNKEHLRNFFTNIVDEIPPENLLKPVVDFQIFRSNSPLRKPEEERISLNELLELFSEEFLMDRVFPAGIEAQLDPYEESTPGSTSPRAPENADKAPCMIGYSSISIDADGFVYPCTLWPKPLGNVKDSSIEWLWLESEEIKFVRSIRLRDMNHCATCTLANYCTGCMAMAYMENGSWKECSTNAYLTASLLKHIHKLRNDSNEEGIKLILPK